MPDRKCVKENEENKNQMSKNCKEHEEFLAHLRDCLDPDKKNEKISDEDLILKVLVCICKRHVGVILTCAVKRKAVTESGGWG